MPTHEDWPAAWRAIAAAIRLAAETDAPIGGAAALLRVAGLTTAPNPSLSVIRAMTKAGALRAERKGNSWRFILPGDGTTSPWSHQRAVAPMTQAMNAIAVASGKRTPWTDLPRAPGNAPDQPAGPPQPLARAGDAMRDRRQSGMRALLHKRRMALARPQTEAEMRALVDSHIAQHGVTRITPAPITASTAAPINSSVGSLRGSGMVARRSAS